MAASVALALAMATLSGTAALLSRWQQNANPGDIGDPQLRSSWDQYLDGKNEHAG